MSEQKTTILVVDDAPANIQLLSGVLREKYKVKAAISGVKALAVSQKTPPPDLILLDIIMPELDGYEVCRQLKTNPATMDIPVVFITGNISSQDEQRGLEMGAVAYLCKPIDSDKLLETVERILG